MKHLKEQLADEEDDEIERENGERKKWGLNLRREKMMGLTWRREKEVGSGRREREREERERRAPGNQKRRRWESSFFKL